MDAAQINSVKIHPANTPYNNDQLTPLFPSTSPTPTVDPTLQCVVDSGAQALITIRCGENAAQVLQAAGITIYQSQGRTAQEDLSALAERKLPVMTHFHAGFHGIQ